MSDLEHADDHESPIDLGQWSKLADYLDERCSRDDWCLPFIPTHGFLCAVAIGPHHDQWLASLTEGHQAQLPPWVVDDLTRYLAELERQIAADDDSFSLPFEITDVDPDDSDIGDWCIGFIDYLFSEGVDELWYAGADEDKELEIGDLTLPMIVISGMEVDDDETGKQIASMRRNADTLEDMAEAIPDNLRQLYLLHHAPRD